MNKLPQGVAVTINDSMKLYPRGEPTGVYLTHEQLAERDKAIARAAFERGQESFALYPKESRPTVDDYLQSEEFLKLIGEKE